MSSSVRRLVTTALAVIGVALAIAAPSAVFAQSAAVDQAEAHMLDLINQDRTQRGLVPYRRDAHLMHIAGMRSYDMATKHYFSHRQPDGRTAFDMIDASGITWYSAAEIIAWNNASDLAGSADWANQQWLGSSTHKAAIVSTSYNYIGVGLAVDTSNGRRIWTAVIMKAPDHTGGWVTFDPLPNQLTADTAGTLTTSTSTTTSTSSTNSRSVTVSWAGGDIRLATLTSGFDHFQIRRQIDGGSWVFVSTSTTTHSRTVTVYDGHSYRLSVRSCDRRGNCGTWRYITVSAG
jgi:uncharacterized protein YkwD